MYAYDVSIYMLVYVFYISYVIYVCMIVLFMLCIYICMLGLWSAVYVYLSIYTILKYVCYVHVMYLCRLGYLYVMDISIR